MDQADGQTREGTAVFVQSLRNWLHNHPGEHAPVDVAKAMGVPTHTVAARLIYLSNRGEILRRRVSKSSSRYAAPPTTTDRRIEDGHHPPEASHPAEHTAR